MRRVEQRRWPQAAAGEADPGHDRAHRKDHRREAQQREPQRGALRVVIPAEDQRQVEHQPDH